MIRSMNSRVRTTHTVALVSALLIVGCGGTDDETEVSEPTAAAAPSETPSETNTVHPAGDRVVRENGDVVRVGSAGEVRAEEGDTGEVATITHNADGSERVEGNDGESVATDTEGNRAAQEGDDTAEVRNDGTVVASDGEDSVRIGPNGGINIGGLRIGH